jgi:hypothetical protein
MLEHISPELFISAVRLLMEAYKFGRDQFKDKKTPERVEEILTRAEMEPGVDRKQIEERIAQQLDPEDAAIVTNDLALLSLLVLPSPSLDAFDYWGKLTQLVSGLQAFATKNRLFELSGSSHMIFGESLYLAKTSEVLLPKKYAMAIPAPYERQGLNDVVCAAVLTKDHSDFPIRVVVEATFDQYSDIGGQYIVSDRCYYYVGQGQQRHWLRFYLHYPQIHFCQDYQYRLDASELIAIVNALRDDIHDFASTIKAEEELIRPLFAQIDAFVEKMKS